MEHQNEQEIKETLEKLNAPIPEKPHPSLANYAGLLTFLCVGGMAVGALIGYHIGKPTPTIYNLSVFRPDREPLVLPIRTQREANWFLPVGTNPVIVTRISLDKPTE